MDFQAQVFAPAVLNGVTGIRPDSFRAQKRRRVYEHLGILPDGESGRDSAYSLEQVIGIEAAFKLKASVGLELQEAAALIAPVLRQLPTWVARAKEEEARLLEEAEVIPEMEAWVRWSGAPGSMTAPFAIHKSEPAGGGAPQWSLEALDPRNPLSMATGMGEIVIIVDLGKIAGRVVSKLIRGGAMRAAEL